jgi:signal transduction histidine kinase
MLVMLLAPMAKCLPMVDSVCDANQQNLLPGERLTCIFNYINQNSHRYPEQVAKMLVVADTLIANQKLSSRIDEFYFYRGKYFLALNQYDSALTYFNKAKELIASDNINLNCRLFTHYGILLREQGNLKEAANSIKTGLVYAGQIENKNYEAELLLAQGDIHCDLELYTEALNDYRKAQENFKKENDTLRQFLVYVSIAGLYSRSGNLPIALDYLDRAINAFTKNFNAEGAGLATLNKGQVLDRMGSYGKSLENYELAQKYFTRDSLWSLLGQVKESKGRLFKKQHKFNESRLAFEEAFTIKSKIGDLKGQATILLQLGELYTLEKQYSKAHGYYVRSLVLADVLKAYKLMFETYQKIADNYYKQGDYKAAIDYKTKQHMLDKQFLTNEHYLKIANLESRLSAQVNDRDFKEKDLLGSVYRERSLKKRYFALFLIFLCASLLLGALLWIRIYYMNRKSRLAIKQLQQKVRRQKAYIQTIKTQYDTANATLSRYFDITSQNVFEPVRSLEHLLLVIKQGTARDDFQKLPVGQVESLVMSYNLLENLLYWSRLQLDKIEYEPSNHLLSELVHHVIGIQQLRAKQKEIVFRINLHEQSSGYFDAKMIEIVLRNIIENAIKFSTQEGVIEITAKNIDNKLLVVISDAGVGFTKEQLNRIFNTKKNYIATGTHGEMGGGIGLVLTKFLVEKNFGTLLIESSIAKGTEVTLTLPGSINAMSRN